MNGILDELVDSNSTSTENSNTSDFNGGSNNKCPLTIAYEQIYAGGYEPDNALQVHVGGTDCYISDNIRYYINTRTILLARMKLTKVQLSDIMRKLFSHYSKKTHVEVFNMILEESTGRQYAAEQIVKLMVLVANIDAYVQKKLLSDPLNLNLSLPELLMPEGIEVSATRNNHVLKEIINKIIAYMRKLDLRGLGIEPALIEDFDEEPPVITHSEGVIELNLTNPTDEDIKKIHAIEIEISNKVIEYEKYQCGITNHVNKIFELMKVVV
jgi:hypothetical protein